MKLITQVLAWAMPFLGDAPAAIENYNWALRLSPLDPRSFFPQNGLAHANFLAGRYDEASAWATKVIR